MLTSIHLIVILCALSHSGFGGSRGAISLYALHLGASQFSIGVIMALYAGTLRCPDTRHVFRGFLTKKKRCQEQREKG